MAEIKSKSVIIDGGLHSQLKTYCNKNGHKLGWLIERLIKEFLEKNKDK
jgi:hypothetical protein